MPNPLTLSSRIAIIVLTVCTFCFANGQTSAVHKADSSRAPLAVPHTATDSNTVIALHDSIAIADSVHIATPLPDSLGRMSTPSLVGTYDRSLEQRSMLARGDLHWLDYRYLGTVLESMPGIFLREQNSIGQYSQLNIRGVDWRSIAITADGRPLNDPASGIFNLSHFTVEYADRIEVITGPRAFIYGLQGTGGAINLLTKNYNSNRPFSKLNYAETGYNYQYSDGTFSQNISRKINFTFGFQHQSTDGRFANSAHEAWNARVKVRYNISTDLNVILSEYHTATKTQLNGGVSYALSGPVAGLDPLLAVVRNDEAYEKITRNDVDLSLVGTFLNDTTNVSILTLYYSRSMREYRDEESSAGSTNQFFLKSDHASSWMGARLSQNYDTEFQRFSFGSTIELRQIEGSPNLGRRRNVIGSLWAKEELVLSDIFTLAGFGRYDRYLGKAYTGFGVDATVRILDGLSFFAGLSRSRRMPSYEELYWVDSAVTRTAPINAEKHFHAEAGAELKFPDNSFIRASYFRRTVDDAISALPFTTQSSIVSPALMFTNVPRVITNGVEATMGVRVWVLYLEGAATYMVQSSAGIDTRFYPRLWANGGIYYWNTLLNGKLELKVGFKGRYQSSHLGAEFNPEVLAYVASNGPALGQSASGDFFLTAHIGDAYIHFMWENLNNATFFSTPFYPVLDRAFKVGVSWEFLN